MKLAHSGEGSKTDFYAQFLRPNEKERAKRGRGTIVKAKGHITKCISIISPRLLPPQKPPSERIFSSLLFSLLLSAANLSLLLWLRANGGKRERGADPMGPSLVTNHPLFSHCGWRRESVNNCRTPCTPPIFLLPLFSRIICQSTPPERERMDRHKVRGTIKREAGGGEKRTKKESTISHFSPLLPFHPFAFDFNPGALIYRNVCRESTLPFFHIPPSLRGLSNDVI